MLCACLGACLYVCMCLGRCFLAALNMNRKQNSNRNPGLGYVFQFPALCFLGWCRCCNTRVTKLYLDRNTNVTVFVFVFPHPPLLSEILLGPMMSLKSIGVTSYNSKLPFHYYFIIQCSFRMLLIKSKIILW